jgi:hypothetical protein
MLIRSDLAPSAAPDLFPEDSCAVEQRSCGELDVSTMTAVSHGEC